MVSKAAHWQFLGHHSVGRTTGTAANRAAWLWQAPGSAAPSCMCYRKDSFRLYRHLTRSRASPRIRKNNFHRRQPAQSGL